MSNTEPNDHETEQAVMQAILSVGGGQQQKAAQPSLDTIMQIIGAAE